MSELHEPVMLMILNFVPRMGIEPIFVDRKSTILTVI